MYLFLIEVTPSALETGHIYLPDPEKPSWMVQRGVFVLLCSLIIVESKNDSDLVVMKISSELAN